MEAIDRHPNLNLKIIATGMHMNPKFGNSIEIVKKKFPNVYSFPIHSNNNNNNNNLNTTAQEMAECLNKTNQVLSGINPDMFMFLGDRFETYAAASAALVRNIPLIHVNGGDRTKGGFDECFRHALTKISHIHFPSTKKNAERIKKMGENPKYIFTVGSPSLDTILNQKLIPKRELFRKYKIENRNPLALMVQHSVTSQVGLAKKQIKQTLEALEEENIETILVYPNNDEGHKTIIKEIEKYKTNPNFHIHPNIPHIDYLSILAHSNLMIGNSSSGIVDSTILKIPTINIGIRQEGRERGNNIIDVPHNKVKIKKAIQIALYNRNFKKQVKKSKSPYGSGTTGNKIANILATIEIDQNITQKQIAY